MGIRALKRSAEIIRLLRENSRDVASYVFVQEKNGRDQVDWLSMPFDHVIDSWREIGSFPSRGCVVDLPTCLQASFLGFARFSVRCPVVALEWCQEKENIIVDSINLRGGKEGLRFAVIRKEILSQIKERSSINKFYDCVVMLGGGDCRKHGEEILNLFCTDPRFSRRKIAFISGPFARVGLPFDGDSQRVDFYHDPENLAEIMACARVGLSNAGTSLMELCALGIPTIIFPQSEEEESFSQVFFKAGCSIAGCIESDRFFSQVNELLTNKTVWAERSRKACSLIDGQGAKRVVEQIEKILY
jgi:hypothetical protein